MYAVIMDLSFDSPHLPDLVRNALISIYEGATADSQESTVLEFKEDPALNEKSRGRNARAEIIEKLIEESICMANGPASGGYIVVGIADKKAGPEAFLGTDLDEEDVAKKIFNRTKPNMRVDVTPVMLGDVRVLVVYVPEALDVYSRQSGAASKRIGSKCEPLSDEERQALAFERRNPDFSNRVSSSTVEDYSPDVIAEARRLLRIRREGPGETAHVPETTTGLLRELGLLDANGSPKRAADILFAQRPPGVVTVRHLWRTFPGADPQVQEYSGPLLVDLPRLRRKMEENADTEIGRVSFANGQEIPIPRFPAQAIDEVIINALVHRDWRINDAVVVDQTARLLKVWSPGPLPIGVTEQNLLTTRSIPRNGRLMATMRMLGLAEESSRGFDRMWASMIRTGRDVPEVHATETHVEVILAAGEPDLEFVRALSDLSSVFGPEVVESVNVLIILWHLWSSPMITERTVCAQTQIGALECKDLMAGLEECGLLEAVGQSREWVLSGKAQKVMGILGNGEIAAVSAQEWIREKLDSGESVSSTEISERLGIARKEATDYLRHLRTLGQAQIDPSGPSRGPGTRWIAK
ncbi:ATP-dependent DNA helicase [Corynebacterium renale]|uniref:ATP-dependent DNA helicase RecG n=2 Tax=Corynebacterium renale TaxID=1724 RepID=A0A2A9DN52_9CORY|nr:ATP-dependent DNA helicase RecG [Corynebacterium renale]SQI22085.1 ATP-dependent DNA helicase [Corynebacterium renale]